MRTAAWPALLQLSECLVGVGDSFGVDVASGARGGSAVTGCGHSVTTVRRQTSRPPPAASSRADCSLAQAVTLPGS
jgi:hypothetical protein